MDTCNNILWDGFDGGESPNPKISPPSGGSQTASVVITGDSSDIVFQDTDVGPGAGDWGLLSATGEEYSQTQSSRGDEIINVALKKNLGHETVGGIDQ